MTKTTSLKTIFNIGFFLVSSWAISQIGINNEAPKSTLDVTAKNTDGSSAEGFIAPRLSGDEIQNANSQYGSDQTGAIVYAISKISSTDDTGKTSNITAAGYYYFDGEVWQSFNSTYVSSDATRFLGGTVYVIFNSSSNGTLDSSLVIGGAEGQPYTMGDITVSSAIGGINSIKGNGYTISNPSNGVFDNKLNTSMTDVYGISVNIVDAYGSSSGNVSSEAAPDPENTGIKLKTNDNSQVAFISDTYFRIKTGNDSGTLSNRPFTFLITGK